MSRMMVVVLALRNGKGMPRLMRGLTSRTRWRRAWKYSWTTEAVNWAFDNDIQILTHANGEAASDLLIAAILLLLAAVYRRT